MVSQAFQSLCLEIGITLTVCDTKTTVQNIYFVGMYLLRVVSSQHSTCTDVIEIVQILSCITTHGFSVQRMDSINRLSLKTYVIIIDGIDNGHLRLCINHTLLKAVRQFLALFTDTQQMVLRTLPMFIESAVIRTTLTETHILNFGNIELYLIISYRQSLVKLLFSMVVMHTNHRDKCHVVECLSTPSSIANSSIVSSLRINLCRVNVSVVTGIGERIQLVHRLPVWR